MLTNNPNKEVWILHLYDQNRLEGPYSDGSNQLP